jgi:hypothetical protein
MQSAASVASSIELSCHLTSPLCLTTFVLLIPHQLQLSSSLRFTLAPCSSRQRTAQVTQLLTDLSPAHVVIAVGLCPLRLYVRRCNTTPSPWWLLCLQWSVLLTTRTAELLSGLIANFSRLCVTRYVMLEHLCASITPLHPRSRAERRYEKSFSPCVCTRSSDSL